MSLQYHFVLPPTGPADAGVVAEMFDDVKTYLDSFVPVGGAAPFDAQYVTLATNAILTSERILTGTANQVVITDNGAGSTVVLSLPQSIANTSSPSFAGLLYRNGSGNTVTINPPSSFSNYTLTLPTDDGNADQVLKTNGSGVLSWVDQTATGANTALSNLASVAINTSLLPGANGTIDLGAAGTQWRDVHVSREVVLYETGTSNDILIKAPTSLASYILTLPDSGGTSGYVLRTDGSGTTSWVPQTSTSGSATTELDNLGVTAVNTHIKPGSDDSIDLGSGSKTWRNIYTKSGLYLQESGVGTDTILLKAPAAMSAAYTFTLPATGGTNNYILKTDGSGTTDWVSAGTIIAGATVALDNLSGVAINTSLIVATGHDQSYDLGSTTLAWRTLYAANVYAGRSGVPGIVEIWPSTASKGTLVFAAADNAGSTDTTIINASQAGSRTYTIPDAGASASFVMTEGTQTVNGAKAFGSQIIISATSNHLKLATASNNAIISAASIATADRTITIPDPGANANFVLSEAAATINGQKTFGSAVLFANGSVSAPNGFSGDTNNGFYYIGTDNWALSANSTKCVDIKASGVAVLGTNTNDSAASGFIGEVISSSVANVNAATSGTYGDLTSITLSAGDWDVYIIGGWNQSGSTWQATRFGISTTSGNSTTGLTFGQTEFNNSFASSATTPTLVSANLGPVQFQLTGSTTVYFKYRSTYTGGPPTASGTIIARRRR